MVAVKRRFVDSVRVSIGITLLVFVWPLTVCASSSPVNVDADKIAVSGYDLVSYFDSHAEPGEQSFSARYQGAAYLFSSVAHLELFKADPQRYLPAYGGYCAYGVSMGKRLAIDPERYEVVAGRLYLLLNRITKKTWQLDRAGNIDVADRLWREELTTP